VNTVVESLYAVGSGSDGKYVETPVTTRCYLSLITIEIAVIERRLINNGVLKTK
jgi:hypothetical protein